MASPSDPPTGRAGDTEQFPVARTGAHTAQPSDAALTDAAPSDGPAHAVATDAPGITRGGWWAITIAAATLLILGFLLTFGPARYWTPVPVVFLGYFLISGLIGLVFWKGVRELRDSNPTLHSGDGPASPGARVAAAIGAVGVASALVLIPAGLSDAPASAAPCPDGSNTCGPQPTMGPQPTQGNGGNTTAPQAPNTTVPGYTPPDTPPQQGNGSTPTVQGQVPTMPTGDTPSNGCIFNCGPTQAPQQAPQTGQATPPQTGQNPVTTAPNTPATTPQAPTTTPRLRTPTPETTTSTTSSKARDRDDEQRSSDEDREKNSPYPYQAALFSAVGGTYRRKKTSDAVRDGQIVSTRSMSTVMRDATVVSKPTDWSESNRGKWDQTAKYMYDEITRNKDDSRVDSMRNLIKGPFATPRTYSSALTIWAALVRPGGEWDHKPKIQKLTGSFDEDLLYFQPPYGDHEVYYDVWSNVHYGYIGTLAGFDQATLIAGQNVPVISGKQAWSDTQGVLAGIEMAKAHGENVSWADFNRTMEGLVNKMVAEQEAGRSISQLRPSGQF